MLGKRCGFNPGGGDQIRRRLPGKYLLEGDSRWFEDVDDDDSLRS